eukprot:15335091-Ditylum_brightwellii.AAC.2
MNRDKNKILTSVTGKSILPYIHNKKTNTDLRKALSTFTDSKVTDGIKVLGIPIGSQAYTERELTTFTEDLQEDAAKIIHTMSDKQTATQIYNQCQLQRAPFRMTADVICNGPSSSCIDPFHWQLLTTTAVNNITKGVLAAVLQQRPEAM